MKLFVIYLCAIKTLMFFKIIFLREYYPIEARTFYPGFVLKYISNRI